MLALSSAFASVQASSQTLAGSPPAPVKTVGIVREGTEIKVRLDESLSSKTATAGDTFGVTLDEGIKLSDGVEIPAGFHGKGEVTEAHKVEMMGKAGELNIRLDYIRVGDVRIHLRGSQGSEGKSMQSTAIALSLLVSPLTPAPATLGLKLPARCRYFGRWNLFR